MTDELYWDGPEAEKEIKQIVFEALSAGKYVRFTLVNEANNRFDIYSYKRAKDAEDKKEIDDLTDEIMEEIDNLEDRKIPHEQRSVEVGSVEDSSYNVLVVHEFNDQGELDGLRIEVRFPDDGYEFLKELKD